MLLALSTAILLLIAQRADAAEAQTTTAPWFLAEDFQFPVNGYLSVDVKRATDSVAGINNRPSPILDSQSKTIADSSPVILKEDFMDPVASFMGWETRGEALARKEASGSEKKVPLNPSLDKDLQFPINGFLPANGPRADEMKLSNGPTAENSPVLLKEDFMDPVGSFLGWESSANNPVYDEDLQFPINGFLPRPRKEKLVQTKDSRSKAENPAMSTQRRPTPIYDNDTPQILREDFMDPVMSLLGFEPKHRKVSPEPQKRHSLVYEQDAPDILREDFMDPSMSMLGWKSSPSQKVKETMRTEVEAKHPAYESDAPVILREDYQDAVGGFLGWRTKEEAQPSSLDLSSGRTGPLTAHTSTQVDASRTAQWGSLLKSLTILSSAGAAYLWYQAWKGQPANAHGRINLPRIKKVYKRGVRNAYQQNPISSHPTAAKRARMRLAGGVGPQHKMWTESSEYGYGEIDAYLRMKESDGIFSRS